VSRSILEYRTSGLEVSCRGRRSLILREGGDRHFSSMMRPKEEGKKTSGLHRKKVLGVGREEREKEVVRSLNFGTS